MPADRSSELFASTAPYYARYRPGYDPALYCLLRERFNLDGTARILDIGTGTGVLAIPLARMAARVIAVDPDAGMLAEGTRLAGNAGIANITWLRGDSASLHELGIGQVLLAVMGASFHWTDRDQLLDELDNLVLPGGGVVIASGGAPGTVEPAPWLDMIARVRARYLGPERRAGSGTYSHPRETHQDVIARSPFARTETRAWDRAVTRTLDEVVGLQYSYSYSSPAQLGDRKDAFDQDLRAALLQFSPGGRYSETVRTEAIIATRP
ncbi:MAG: class I SAM-dependent methyltransferase [Streptosporangiaceae bacterium]